MSSDFGKLRTILDLLTPGLVFVSDGDVFGARHRRLRARRRRAGRDAQSASRIARPRCSPICSARTTPAASPQRKQPSRPTPSPNSCSPPARPAARRRVINTHRMLCSNQAMIASGFVFRHRRAAGGGGLAALEPHLRQQPQFQPGALERRLALYRRRQSDAAGRVRRPCATCARSRRPSISTCRRVTRRWCRISAPTRRLRQNFFSRLKVLFYAGAGLNQTTWDELTRLAVETTGERIIFLSSLGSTETVAAGAGLLVGFRPRRQYRPAGARRRTQAGAERRQAGSASARPAHHARLLAAGRNSRARPSTKKASTRSATR